MLKPYTYTPEGYEPHCPFTQGYLVEHILTQNPRPISLHEIKDELWTKHCARVAPSNICAILSKLRDHGKAVRLARGIYIHYDAYRMYS